MNQLQEVNEFLGQPVVVSPVIDELRDKQHFFETSEIEKLKRLNYPHNWFLRDIAPKNSFRKTFLPFKCFRHCKTTTK